MKGAIGGIVVIAEDNQRIGGRDRLVHHPGLRGKTHQGMPGLVDNHENPEKKQQEQEPEENAALFAASHAMGSNLRRRSAASSGMIAL